MWKLLIVLGLLPVVVGVLTRNWLGRRFFNALGEVKVGSSASTLAKRLTKGAALKLRVDEGKRFQLAESQLLLPVDAGPSREVRDVAEACLLAGLAMLARRQPQLPEWRQRALKFSWAFPAFTLLVVIFAFVVAKLPLMPAIAIVVLSIGLGTSAGLVAGWVEWQAAGMVGKLTEARAIFTREDDRQLILKAMKALAAEKALPGFLSKFFRS
ncbi:MAG: hypothetical protein Q7Q71_02750 [Verrucomicrobiota bacterium JB023]|nr:hypothetical protein [Verrucomicrobiota bacterium JB023]